MMTTRGRCYMKPVLYIIYVKIWTRGEGGGPRDDPDQNEKIEAGVLNFIDILDWIIRILRFTVQELIERFKNVFHYLNNIIYLFIF